MIPIDKNIPIPEHLGKYRSKYPFKDMEIGDSFFTEAEGSASNGNINFKPKRFLSRRSYENSVKGHRIWRIE